MQTRAKVMVAFYSLAFAALGVLIIAVAMGWSPAIEQLNAVLSGQDGRWLMGLIGSIIVLISLVLMFNGLKGASPASEAGVVQELNLGRVVTTTTAIESVVRKAVRQVRGVREVRPVISSTTEGLSILLNILLSPDVKVMEVTPKIQENVKQQIYDIVGVDVLEVKIRIENIGYEAAKRVE